MALETLDYSQFPLSDCLKKKRSKRRRHDYEQSEDLNYIAECLIQLARGGTTIPVRPKKVRQEENTHICTVCDREFSSYQALGGHMACHRSKSSSSPAVEKRNSSAGTKENLSGLSPNEKKLHTCEDCGKSFNTGQGLGGHMRMHNAVKSSPDCGLPISKVLLTFDLNLPPPPESDEGFLD